MKTYSSKKKTNKTESRQTEFIMLVFSAFAVETVAFLFFCIMALIFDIKSGNYYTLCIAALSVGSAVSGFISGRKTKKRGLVNGIIYTLPANCFFVLVSLLLNKFRPDYIMAVTFVFVVIFSAVGGILSVNVRSGPKVKIKR